MGPSSAWQCSSRESIEENPDSFCEAAVVKWYSLEDFKLKDVGPYLIGQATGQLFGETQVQNQWGVGVVIYHTLQGTGPRFLLCEGLGGLHLERLDPLLESLAPAYRERRVE